MSMDVLIMLTFHCHPWSLLWRRVSHEVKSLHHQTNGPSATWNCNFKHHSILFYVISFHPLACILSDMCMHIWMWVRVFVYLSEWTDTSASNIYIYLSLYEIQWLPGRSRLVPSFRTSSARAEQAKGEGQSTWRRDCFWDAQHGYKWVQPSFGDTNTSKSYLLPSAFNENTTCIHMYPLEVQSTICHSCLWCLSSAGWAC